MTKQGRHFAVWMHNGYRCAKCGGPIPAGWAMLTKPSECDGGMYFDLVRAGVDPATAAAYVAGGLFGRAA